jgi:hypothetical protein
VKNALTMGCFVLFVASGAWAQDDRQDDRIDFDKADKFQHYLEMRDEPVALYLADGIMPMQLKRCIELIVTSQTPVEFCFGPSGPIVPSAHIGRPIWP